MQAIFLIVGAALGFLGSLLVQRQQRRSQFRTHIYLELLPNLQAIAGRFHRVADQDRRVAAPVWILRDDDWLSVRDTDRLCGSAIVAGRSDAKRAALVRSRWEAMANMMDPDWGNPMDLVYANPAFRDAARQAWDAITAYQILLERRFTWRQPSPVPQPPEGFHPD